MKIVGLGGKCWACVAYALPAILFSIVAACDLFVQRIEPIGTFTMLALMARGVRFGLLVGALGFLIGRIARFLHIALWVWFCLVLAVEGFAHLGFSTVIDGCWVMVIAASSMAEIRSFLANVPVLLLVSTLAVTIGALVVGFRFLAAIPYPRISWRSLAVSLILVLPFAIYDSSWRTRLGAFDALIAFHLPKDALHNYGSLKEFAQAAVSPQLPDGLRLATSTNQAPMGLIVVGESATCRDWGLYGYERPTTPRLSEMEDELIVFRDVTATHDTTALSLKMVFTEATAERPDDAECMFSQKCVAAGYSCALVSAQARWSRWEGVEKFLFSGCDDRWYLAEQPNPEKAARYDDALIAPILSRLESGGTNPVPRLVFAHLMGSHFEPRDRIPPDFRKYPRYQGDYPPGLDADSRPWNILATDEYDNSIAFTDSVLGTLLEGVKKIRRPVFFVYFSDHGETPRASNWRRSGDPDLTAVPLVVWLSPEYRAAFPEVATALERRAREPLRLDCLQTILLPLARVLSGPSLAE